MMWWYSDLEVTCPECGEVSNSDEWGTVGWTCGDGCCSKVTRVWCPLCSEEIDPINVKEAY